MLVFQGSKNKTQQQRDVRATDEPGTKLCERSHDQDDKRDRIIKINDWACGFGCGCLSLSLFLRLRLHHKHPQLQDDPNNHNQSIN